MTPTDFDWAFAQLLVLEGFHSDTPGDAGGDTILGISQRWWPEWHARLAAAQTWTERTCIAKQFYRREYWDVWRLDDIGNKYVAYELFEMSVNLGTPTVRKLLADRLCEIDCGSIDDALARGGFAMTVWWLNSIQYRFYDELVRRRPEKAQFFRGWQRRCWDTSAEIVRGAFTR